MIPEVPLAGCQHRSHSHLQMSIDGLPLWAFLGMTEKRLKPEGLPEVSHQLYTHTHFTMLYHEGWLVEVDLSTVPSRAVDISQAWDLPISFSYSVGWQSTTLPFEGRMLRYTRDTRLPQTQRVRERFLQLLLVCLLLAPPRIGWQQA